jgi:exosortase
MRNERKEANPSKPLRRQTLWFALYTAGWAAVFWRQILELVHVSLSSDTNSHILLIPFISAGLIWTYRGQIFQETRGSSRMFAALSVLGGSVYLLRWRFGGFITASCSFELAILCFCCFILAGFALIYGKQAFRASLFPLFFLLLVVPLPGFLVDRMIWWLQFGSAEVTVWLFHMTGTPVLRHGFLLTVPGVTIEIAKECSGIRSTLALIVTCLLAGYLLLRTALARVVLLLATLPVLVVKNGIRIATLTLLAIHVNPGFLFGRLHREGGIVFFAIGLAILLPVVSWLQRVERKHPLVGQSQEAVLRQRSCDRNARSTETPVNNRLFITRWVFPKL